MELPKSPAQSVHPKISVLWLLPIVIVIATFLEFYNLRPNSQGFSNDWLSEGCFWYFSYIL